MKSLTLFRPIFGNFLVLENYESDVDAFNVVGLLVATNRGGVL